MGFRRFGTTCTTGGLCNNLCDPLGVAAFPADFLCTHDHKQSVISHSQGGERKADIPMHCLARVFWVSEGCLMGSTTPPMERRLGALTMHRALSERALEKRLSIPGLLEASCSSRGVDMGDVYLNAEPALAVLELSNLSEQEITLAVSDDLEGQLVYRSAEDVSGTDLSAMKELGYFGIFSPIGASQQFVLAPADTLSLELQFCPRISVLWPKQGIRDTEEEFASSIAAAAGWVSIQCSLSDGSPSMLSIPFRARVCNSLLVVDVDEIIFENATLKQLHVRDFAVRNMCEFPLCFRVLSDVSTEHSPFSLTGYDTGAAIDDVIVPGFGQHRIRVSFCPTELGEYDFAFVVENVRNAGNATRISVHANVQNIEQQDTFTVSCGNYLDFGKCYAFKPEVRSVVVKNTSNRSMEVRVVTDMEGSVAFFEEMIVNDSNDEMDEDERDSFHGEVIGNVALSDDSDPEPTSSKENVVATNGGSNGIPIAAPGIKIGRINKNDSKKTDDKRKSALRNRIDEFVLGSGRERTIIICFTPVVSDDNRKDLQKQSFRAVFRCKQGAASASTAANTVSRTVICHAMVSESIVSLITPVIHMGDCEIGVLKMGVLSIENISALPAKVQLQYESSVMKLPTELVEIPPKANRDFPLRFTP